MRANIREHLQHQSEQIRSQLNSRPRQVEPGCLIKVSLCNYIGKTNITDDSVYIYDIVGKLRGTCDSSNARAYDVLFSLDGVQISRHLYSIFTIPVYENDMEILRSPEQNASIDGPNIDRYFQRVDGKWISRSSNNINY